MQPIRNKKFKLSEWLPAHLPKPELGNYFDGHWQSPVVVLISIPE
jgi:hypothetical protein